MTRVGVGVIGTTTADALGAWSFDSTATALASGQYTFMATATTGGAASPASTPFVVTVDTAAPTIPSIARYNPVAAATSADTLVFRVTWIEPVQNVDAGDFQLTVTGGVTGTISGVTAVNPSVYDVTVTGVAGDGTIRLDRRASATVVDYAGNPVGSGTYTGGQVYSIRAVGSGVWINGDSDGSWSDTANWDPVWGGVADGATSTADFGSLDIIENRHVGLDSPRTIGRLVFGDVDQSSPATWTLDDGGNPTNALTLASTGAPTIQVNYTGAAADSNATIAAAGAAYPATLDLSLTGTGGLTKAGWGTASLVRPVSVTGALAVTQGYLRLSPGSSLTSTSGAIAASAQLQVAGGTFTTPGTITITNGGTSGLQVSGGTATINKVTTAGDRDGVVRISGGRATIGEVALLRTSNSETEAATFSRAGFFVSGGVADVGTLTIPSGNSWSVVSVEGGELNVSGPTTLANQASSARGALMRVTGGRLTLAEATNGLVLSKVNGANANNVAKVWFTGGVSTMEKLTLGFDATVSAGSAAVVVDGGTLYLGAGGLVKNGTSGMATSVTLTSGVLGAKASWSTVHPLILGGGTTASIKAGDEADGPHDIALDGVLSGVGGFAKIGGGTVSLGAANTFAGAVELSSGTLAVAGSIAAGSDPTVGVSINGGSLTGTGTIARPVTIGSAGRLVPGNGTAGATLTVGDSVTWNGGGRLVGNFQTGGVLAVSGALVRSGTGQVVELSTSAPLAVGATITLATYASTDLVSSDLVASGLAPYRGSFVVNATSLQFVVQSLGVYPLDVTLAGTGTGTVTSSPSGIDCGSDCTEVFDDGVLVTLEASPGTGSTFDGWSGACTGASLACDVTIDEAKSVTATFKQTAGYYVLSPCRVFDSRNTSALAAASETSVMLREVCGLPSSAKNVAVNITVTGPTAAGYLTLFADGTSRPVVSALNFSALQTRANNAVLPLGSSGALRIFLGQATGTAHVILDVNGYFE